MSTDTEKHRALLSALKDAQGKGDGSFERAVTDAFEHLGRLNDHVSLGGPDGGDPHLKPGESPPLR